MAFLEPIILYLVLFFPGLTSGYIPAEAIITFSAFRELARLFTYVIPALALIWYLILEKNSLPLSMRDIRIKKADGISFIIGLPLLILAGAFVSLLMNKINPDLALPAVQAPENITGWIILAVSCTGTGYLEESFFRFYLLQKLYEWIPSGWIRVLFSVLLFALCHAYEGPWGILNAAIAGLILSILFMRYRTIHGIVWSHACYNAFVYVMGIFV